MTDTMPIEAGDVEAARARLGAYLRPTPLRAYAGLDQAVGHGIRVLVKHENHNPTGAFKARNGLNLIASLGDDERRRGVVAASTGNHGAGLAWAGGMLGVSVTICVPVGNNPEKNAAMRGFGASVVEEGRDYDSAVQVAAALARERGFLVAHSTNDRRVIAGAATLSAEILDEAPDLDALVIAVGGGSQAVGAIVVARARRPSLRVYAVQAAGAAAIHDSWHARRPVSRDSVATFADGIATRGVYELTFPALLAGLAGFVTVTDTQIAEAVRVLLRTTHNLAEGAGAAGLAGLCVLAPSLAGQRVGIVLSGGNLDLATLRRVVDGEL